MNLWIGTVTIDQTHMAQLANNGVHLPCATLTFTSELIMQSFLYRLDMLDIPCTVTPFRHPVQGGTDEYKDMCDALDLYIGCKRSYMDSMRNTYGYEDGVNY